MVFYFQKRSSFRPIPGRVNVYHDGEEIVGFRSLEPDLESIYSQI